MGTIRSMLIVMAMIWFASPVIGTQPNQLKSRDSLRSTESGDRDTLSKTGWSIGGVPALGYDADKGFQYGLVLAGYNFGDGSTYPNYRQTVQLEWSRYTGGSGINQVFFDAREVLSGSIRLTGFIGYLTEQLQPFYGLNGYQTPYYPAYIVSDPDEPDYHPNLYKSRVYYTYDRKLWQFTLDLQGPIAGKDWRWIGGLGSFRFTVGPTDVNFLNKRLDPEQRLPDSTLYADMRQSGEIPSSEVTGGMVNYLKIGLIHDTRDQEANPMSGLWSEVLVTTFPSWLGGDFSFTLLTLTHRQYFTFIPRDLSFAYRVGFQGNISGRTPFFMEPFLMSSYKVPEGLGGQRTLRGILQNRVVGQAVGFGNFELRWKFFRTSLFHQQFYAAGNAFLDSGRVLSTRYDALHTAYGLGVRIAMNQNFIVGADYGRPLDDRDGAGGFYISLGYLY